MKKLLLILLLLPLISFGQLGDYYNAEGHPKAKGLNFKIRKPIGFEQNEADRPNIVQKWEKYKTDNDKYLLIMTLVKKLPSEMQGFSTDEWTQFLKSEEGVGIFAPDDAYNNKFIVVDNYPGVYFDSSDEISRMDLTFKRHISQITVLVDGYGFTMMFFAPSKKLLEANYGLFYKLANSVVFPDQYN